MVFQFCPLLEWNALSKFVPRWHEMHCPLLRETLVSETTIYEGHREIDMLERAPLAKIPHHESNKIDGSSIEGPSIDHGDFT